MASPTPLRAALWLTMVTLITLVMVAPTGALISGHSTFAPSASGAPARPGALLAPAVPASHVANTVTAGGRIYHTQTTNPVGSAQPGLVATDNVSGTVFSVSEYAPLLVAFNGFTGAQERALVLGNASAGVTARSIAFDNVTDRLYLGVTSNAGSLLEVIDAATFAWVTNLTFATSAVPTFAPVQELFDYHTNQLLVENSSTQDVMSVNTTTNTFAAFIQVPCSGIIPYGACTSYFGMFEMLDSFASWIAIVPAESSYAWSVYLAPNPVNDTLTGGFNGSQATPAFIFGPGGVWPAFNETYFANASGDGDVAYFDQVGTLGGVSLAIAPGYPTSMVDDPTTGWLVLSVENTTGGFGAQVDLINPFSVSLGGYVTNTSLGAYVYINQVAPFDASNGTGYIVTSGASPGTQELVMVGTGTP
ncbi:MAG TPA: hypothetical protein VGP88_03500, partial [Thermoplasmata archaeon]|nr:hypothetical protein [Thermoplasmata archaeon]